MRTVSPYHRHRFPAEIISHSVWLYFRFALSFRDVEEMLAQRGVVLTYETIRAWCLKFGQTYANDLRRRFRGQAINGTLMKCSSRSTEAFITYGVQLTRMAKFWT
jgi:transposase-like protein